MAKRLKLGIQVGLGPGDCVRWGPRSPQKGGTAAPKFSAHVYCRQTAGWIKMPLGTEVGLGPADIVLNGDPAPLPKKGTQPSIFGPHLLWPNGWMDQDATWYGVRPRSIATLCSMGTQLAPEQRAHPPHPVFGLCLLCPNGWMHQDATWYGGKRQPRGLCVR